MYYLENAMILSVKNKKLLLHFAFRQAQSFVISQRFSSFMRNKSMPSNGPIQPWQKSTFRLF